MFFRICWKKMSKIRWTRETELNNCFIVIDATILHRSVHFCIIFILGLQPSSFTNPGSTVYGWNIFRKAAFSNIEFLLKSCVGLKFKNWNGGRGFDVIFVWRWVLVLKEISNATFVIQLMLQFYSTLDSSFESTVSITNYMLYIS